jgi:hypothetical protein
MITQAELKALLDYNPDTGVFTWRVDRTGGTKAGDTAGCKHKDCGYIRVKLNEKAVYAHLLAWLYIYGKLPQQQLDHKDGCRTNNAISNLREITNRENQNNQRRHREGKLVGAHLHKKTGRYESSISIDGKKVYLGIFQTEEEANAAYLKAKAQLAA